MKISKWLAVFSLVIWTLILILITGLIVYFVGPSQSSNGKSTSNSLVIGLMAVPIIFSMFVIVWWCIIMNKVSNLDMFTKIITLVLLNVPAYLFMESAVKYNKVLIEEETKDKSKYIQQVEEQITEDVFIPEWEKELIAKKAAKKNNKIKVVAEKTPEALKLEQQISIDRKIVRNFVKFVMYKVFVENEGITNTFKITELIKEKVYDKDIREKLIEEYSQTFSEWMNVEDDEEINAESVYDLLIDFNTEEIMVAHKQDRVDITIEVQVKLGL
ncbi:hypothetical protein [[Acholeplasma] multilocale]|uniref:hypothetical protein n=1 Tax=[Acholeplasma] multilocale TaxID=264638 RepID=UPI000478A910|nr:hypothetical protein [[Acholeplasma] multilocale]